jgi:galactoside O-acetyltransferase
MPYLTKRDLSRLGFKSLGEHVRISSKASIYHPERISIGSNVRIDDFALLSAGEMGIEIGSYVHIAAYCGLFGNERITLSDYSGLSSKVCIYSASDDYSGNALTNPTTPADLRNPIVAPVHLGRHVIVGAGATILPGVTLADGCAVGAHSLVTKSFEKLSIIAGIPAKYVKKRSGKLFEMEVAVVA